MLNNGLASVCTLAQQARYRLWNGDV